MKMRDFVLGVAAVAACGSMAAAAFGQAAAGEPAAAAANALTNARPGDADGAFVEMMRFSEPDGEKIYRRVCSGCHMPDAMGAQGAGHYPALAKNQKLAAGAYPIYVVMKGLNGMPPVGRMMTDQQAANVVNYVRTHFGNKYKDAVTAEDARLAR